MNEENRIAIVEDNAPQRLILTRLLEAGHAVQAFASGDEFLAAQPDVDCVLLDIEMPGLDGYEVCRRLRTRASGLACPCFCLRPRYRPERLTAYEAGGDDFITKPISAQELLHKVSTLIARSRQLRELEAHSQAAQQVAFAAMSSMGDLGAVLEFMRRSAAAEDLATLARLLLDAMHACGLRGIAEVGQQRSLRLRVGRSRDPAAGLGSRQSASDGTHLRVRLARRSELRACLPAGQ